MLGGLVGESESGLLEMPEAAPAPGPALEPQADLSGVQGHEPASAAPGQEATAEAAAVAALRAETAGHLCSSPWMTSGRPSTGG